MKFKLNCYEKFKINTASLRHEFIIETIHFTILDIETAN